eukprot:1675595-Rhodomonas_salina.1
MQAGIAPEVCASQVLPPHPAVWAQRLLAELVSSSVPAALTKAWAQWLPSAPKLTQSTLQLNSDKWSTHEPSSVIPGPFDNNADNLVWAAEIALITSFPTTRWQRLTHLTRILQPFRRHLSILFWKIETNSEVDCLMEKESLKVCSRKDLTADELTLVYCSSFHCKIKRHTSSDKQGKGNKMEKGDAFFDSFSSTPRAAAMLCVVSTAAAQDMHLHTVDLEQAFIQGHWSSLPEGAPMCFIKQPSGWDRADALGPCGTST